MAVWVTGASGLLGSEFRERLDAGQTYFSGHKDCDITDINSIRKYISGKNINYIINCAADRNAEAMESDDLSAKKISVDGPQNLAVISKEIGATLIHFSSDYVFDGKKSYPYVETDDVSGLSVYGRLKAEGEKAVLEYSETAIVIRTAWLFSQYSSDFVKTIKNIAESKKEIRVIYDQVGSPCYAGDLAEAVLQILPKIKKGTREIYHYTNEGVCSWFDFAYQIVKEFNINCKVIPIHTGEFVQKAPRPHFSVLDKTKIKNDFALDIRHYLDGLKDCVRKIRKMEK